MKSYIKISLFYLIKIILFPDNIQAQENIAVVNIYDIFQKSSQQNIIVQKLTKEFQQRITELQNMEQDLHNQMQNFQHSKKNINIKEKKHIETSLNKKQEILTKKIKIFEQESIKRQTEEKNKFLQYINKIIQNIAIKNNFDIIIESNAIVYTNQKIKNITNEVLQIINK
ncbi:MAG: periplasmic chaperone Skp [Candidatus Westeberhardia cardiocondylae]|nr:periplasmic chaperone Skp [Candidatus Westeberhardia cardiocondylae]